MTKIHTCSEIFLHDLGGWLPSAVHKLILHQKSRRRLEYRRQRQGEMRLGLILTLNGVWWETERGIAEEATKQESLP